jgi:hypothetical protein
MKPTEIVIVGIEKIKPITVSKYEEPHKIHSGHVDDISVPSVVKRAEKETEKMVKRK